MFFFNDTATTEIYTLSLHDALPISSARAMRRWCGPTASARRSSGVATPYQRHVVNGADPALQAYMAEHGARETPAQRALRSEERRVGKGVDLGGRRIIKKKRIIEHIGECA